MVDLNFDRDDLADDEFDVLPAGIYVAEITRSENKETNDKQGSYLSLGFQLTDHPLNQKDGKNFKGRYVFTNLNLQNKNEKTVKIAESQLKKIMIACGVKNVRDSQQLHGKPMKIKVKVRKSDEYGDSNDIKGFMPLDGGGLPVGGGGGSSASAGGGGGGAPWNK